MYLLDRGNTVVLRFDNALVIKCIAAGEWILCRWFLYLHPSVRVCFPFNNAPQRPLGPATWFGYHIPEGNFLYYGTNADDGQTRCPGVSNWPWKGPTINSWVRTRRYLRNPGIYRNLPALRRIIFVPFLNRVFSLDPWMKYAIQFSFRSILNSLCASEPFSDPIGPLHGRDSSSRSRKFEPGYT